MEHDEDEEAPSSNFMGIALMAGNYEKRCVGQWVSNDEKRMVSTAQVFDGARPFETAFMHPEYNGGSMIIVEAYDTKVEAAAGHARWLKVMTEGPLPDELVDCCNAGIMAEIVKYGGNRVHKRKV